MPSHMPQHLGRTNTPGTTLVQSGEPAITQDTEQQVTHTSSGASGAGPPSDYVCRVTEELQSPKPGDIRVTYDDVKVDDIITSKPDGDTIFCRVTKVNRTCIRVDDLEIQWVNNHTEFHKVIKDMPHKGSLGYSRKMFIMDRNALTFR
jgi:hypothetical protein